MKVKIESDQKTKTPIKRTKTPFYPIFRKTKKNKIYKNKTIKY